MSALLSGKEVHNFSRREPKGVDSTCRERARLRVDGEVEV